MLKRATKGFSLVELLTAVAIIGILAAIAVPMYGRYIRKSRTSEAISNLGTIALYEETFFSESSSYASAGANPAGTVPSSSDTGGRKSFSTGVTGWSMMGNIIPDGTPVYFQYEVHAGQFDSGGTIVTGDIGNLISYSASVTPGASSCTPNLGPLTASNLGIPNTPSSNWFFATAVGNQKSGGACSMFVKVVDRSDIYRENETE